VGRARSLPGSDGWVSLHLADSAPLTLPEIPGDASMTPLHERVLEALAGGGAFFFRQLSDAIGSTDDPDLVRLSGTWSGPAS
jgi:ATP-dependent Lhr-like helicase